MGHLSPDAWQRKKNECMGMGLFFFTPWFERNVDGMMLCLGQTRSEMREFSLLIYGHAPPMLDASSKSC